jgi:hypothetical protein
MSSCIYMNLKSFSHSFLLDKFNCNHCHVNSEHYVPDCDVVCGRCTKECSPVNIIEGPRGK